MARILIRIIMMSGATALVNWWTKRQEAKARSSGQNSELARDQARRQGQTLKRTLRLMRRFMRF